MKWASFVSVKVIPILPTFWRLLRFGLISARAGYLANMTSREVSYKIIIFIYIFINYTYSSVRRMYLSFIRFVKHVPSGTYTCETTMATYPLKLFIHRKWTMFKMFIFQFYSNLVHHIGYFYYFWLCYFWVIQHIFCFCIFFSASILSWAIIGIYIFTTERKVYRVFSGIFIVGFAFQVGFYTKYFKQKC